MPDLPEPDRRASPPEALSRGAPRSPSPTASPPREDRAAFPPGTSARFFLAYAALFLPLAVAAPYLQVLLEGRGFGERDIGLIQGTLAVMAVLAPPLWGYLSDRTHSRRLVLAVIIACMIPSFLLFGAVTTLVPALAAAVLFGFFSRPLIPLTDGLTFRHIHERGGDYGKVRIGGLVAFMATVGGLALLGASGEGGTPVILAAMAVAGLAQLASVLALPRDAGPEDSPPAAAPRGGTARLFLARGFVMFTLAAFLGRVAMMSYYHFFSLYLKREIGCEMPGLVWMLGPLAKIPMIYFSTRVMKRVGVKALFALGVFGIVVRLGCFSLVTSVWQVVPLQLLHALTFGAFHTASVTYVSRLAPAHMKSSAQTVFHAVTLGLGGIVGGALGGAIAERFGFRVLYAAFAGVALAALVVLAFVPSDRPGRRG